MNSIADKIKANLKLFNMSERELADLIGTDQTTVSRWVIGMHSPQPKFIGRMSEVFNCSYEYLTGRYDA